MAERILVVDDDETIRRTLRINLRARGYEVEVVGSGRDALSTIDDAPPDLVVLDLGLPDVDGVDVIRGIREWSSMPVIVLSARTQERTKIDALDAGANDYVTKPFAAGELLARVRAALRHRHRAGEGPGVLRLGDVRVDLERRVATRGASALHLTPIEFRLLATLARHLGMVVAHRELLQEVWGPTHAKDTHYLRIYAKALRDKIEADPVRPRYLLTETGVGYRLLPDE